MTFAQLCQAATPRPWRTGQGDDLSISDNWMRIFDAKNREVAEVQVMTYDHIDDLDFQEAKANAALLVRAVNAVEALAKAVQECLGDEVAMNWDATDRRELCHARLSAALRALDEDACP